MWRWSACYKARRVFEISVDGKSLCIYSRQDRSKHTFFGAYALRWRSLSRSCPGVLLSVPNLDMSFVRHATEVQYVRRMREMLRIDILFERVVGELSRCCLRCLFSLYYPIWEVDIWGQDLDIIVWHRSKVSLVCWNNAELSAVRPARRGLLNAAAPEFCHELENFTWFYVATSLCFSYISNVLTRDDLSLTSRVLCLKMLKIVVFTIGEFFRTNFNGSAPKYGRASTLHESDHLGVIDLLGLRYWTLALSVGLFQLLEKYYVDAELDQDAPARASEIEFGAAENLGWFPFDFEDSILYDVRAFKDLQHTAISHLAVLVRYRVQ